MREFDRSKALSISVVDLSDSDPSDSPVDTPRGLHKLSPRTGFGLHAAEMKARQRSKIGEIREALVAAGFVSLDEQSEALGLGRSTTWTILRANHKGSGLTAAIITRMLLSPQLPLGARAKILEYVEEKVAGSYGGSMVQRRRFAARVSISGALQSVPEVEYAMSRKRKTA